MAAGIGSAFTGATPPPFDLVVAPLGALPISQANLLVLGGTGALYVRVLRPSPATGSTSSCCSCCPWWR